MRFLITGECGFIGRNLARILEEMGHVHVSVRKNVTTSDYATIREIVTPTSWHRNKSDADWVPCVHRTTPERWYRLFSELDVDVVIHNAATVGTDVVGLHPDQATLTNVLGTRNVVEGAKRAGTAVSYMGTSVIYDVKKYQDFPIIEPDDRNPPTFYGQLKLTGEDIVTRSGAKWNIIRPLFAYGGDGDMNSLIAKTLYAFLTERDSLDMFLDPSKVKDYIHVDDYCRAVITACEQGLWGEDYNVAAETALNTAEIVTAMEEILRDAGFDCPEGSLNKWINWLPQTEYLGNHRMSSAKFRAASGWSPQLTLKDGMARVLESIQAANEDYNPLHYLDDAQSRKIDLVQFFPEQTDI
jgi:nucleoside-diphosphate-sugar epimerase